jgi:hypothetical protein
VTASRHSPAPHDLTTSQPQARRGAGVLRAFWLTLFRTGLKMTRTIVRKRFYTEMSLAIAAACLGVLTIFWPDWIEALTGLNPDAHNGSAEWLIVAGLGLVAAACAFLARRQYLRARLQAA